MKTGLLEGSYGGRHNGQYFRQSMSTWQLPSLAGLGHSIHVGGTLENIWNGFPVLITATTDKSWCMHPLTHKANKSRFQIHREISKALGGEVNVPLLTADAAEANTNGYIAAFEATILNRLVVSHVGRSGRKICMHQRRNHPSYEGHQQTSACTCGEIFLASN